MQWRAPSTASGSERALRRVLHLLGQAAIELVAGEEILLRAGEQAQRPAPVAAEEVQEATAETDADRLVVADDRAALELHAVVQQGDAANPRHATVGLQPLLQAVGEIRADGIAYAVEIVVGRAVVTGADAQRPPLGRNEPGLRGRAGVDAFDVRARLAPAHAAHVGVAQLAPAGEERAGDDAALVEAITDGEAVKRAQQVERRDDGRGHDERPRELWRVVIAEIPGRRGAEEAVDDGHEGV